AAVATGVVLGWQREPFFSPSARLPSFISPAIDDSVVSFRVRFGTADKEPGAWDGSIIVTSGEILNLRNWHPRPDDQIKGKTAWVLSTRRGRNFRRRAWEEQLSAAAVKYLLIPGLVVDVKASAGTTVKFETKKGEFTVKPQDLEAGNPVAFLGGNVIVDRVPLAQKMSTDEYENDFPTLLGGSDGELWIAWVAYRNRGNEVLVRRFDGTNWGEIQKVTMRPSDIFLVKMGRDRKGNPWVVWSAQEENNWDLYARRFEGNSWSAVERLTFDPQPDISHKVATDSDGNLWMVWQGFRSGKSDIFVRRYDGDRWSPIERISLSPANDWEPAIAADGAGRVYVAWDTYDKGNYDILMRRFAGGKWEKPIAVADSLKFEAQVSLACDKENRLWVAWNESGTQWGKDSGFLVKKETTRLYQWRSMAVAVYTGKQWQEPAGDLNQSLPQDLVGYNDFPILQVDAWGRPWVFFRHRTLRIHDTPSNAPAHRAAWEIFAAAYDGDRWTTPVHFPFSQDRTDVRAGFASDGRGNLYAAWATDNRDFEEFLFQRSDIYAARLPALPSTLSSLRLKPRVVPELTVFPVHPNEAEDLARIRNYTIESEGKIYRIYRGDIHRHTEFSMDGNNEGTLLQTYRYAMDAAELDFLGVSDHNHLGGPDVEYVNWLLQQTVDLFTLPRTFTPLYAYERSVRYPNGHRNILFARRGNPTLPIPEEERQGETGAQRLYDYLKRYRGIAISHTSATNMGTDWRDNDPEVEPLVEIYQGDRVSAEYEGAPKAAHAGNPSSAPGGFRPSGYVWNAWAKGYKLGIQASSDHLSNHISYACTLATEFTREGLLDAMRRRHSYGATDNIILDYRLQAGGKEYLQGDIVKVNDEFRLWVKVIGTAPIRQIDIIKNNSFLHTTHPLEQEVSITFLDNQPSSGESYYYVRVI
ncbi:DUF3604 domain-containing protein, partial [Acidobacteria bacterium AH-259-A15]|nr:DUF3604 domain-containing protein [Acidobacteria bacterium AH-259-A15]